MESRPTRPKPANHDQNRHEDSQDQPESSSNRPSPTESSPRNIGPPPFNWQASKTNLKERFSFLFANETLSDVHFLVGREPNRRRIPAHKFLLSAGSSVFDAMFNGPMAKRKRTDNDEQEEVDIELPDIEPAAFLAMLSFIYSDEVEIGPETVMTTLYTAKKYAIPALEQKCVEFLKKNLNSGNAFLLLTQARLFDEPQLAELCLDTIDKHTTDAMQAEGFVDIDLDTLCCVLERDTLRIAEAKLFQAVLWWTEAQCSRKRLTVTPENQRALLDRALALIRFPLMSVEEFANGPAQSQILTDREVVELFLYFTVNPKPRVMFNDTPRCCMIGKELSVVRFRDVESRWGYSGTSDRIRFVVDRRIFVIGFGLYGSIMPGSQDYEVTISLVRTGATKPMACVDSTFTSDGSTTLFRVLFPDPVEVVPNVSYTASAALKGADSYYGTRGMGKVAVDCPAGGKITFHFSFAAGNNNGTSVDDGQLPEILFYV